MTLALAAAGCGDDDRPAVDAGGGGDGSMDASPPECPTGTTLCGSECVSTSSSRAHCGACDNACGAGEACVDSACVVICPSGQTECDGECVNTSTNRNHCGACGAPCASGEICVDDACELSCPDGQSVCGGTCVDTESDPNHCGGCDTACDAGQVCNEGTCSGSCSTGLTDCGGACVDTQTSPDHCGACDAACPTATAATGLCVAGSCRLACDPLVGDCNADLGTAAGDGCETPLETDIANCGVCGRACDFDNSTAACVAAECEITACETGFDDCDGVVTNGCEADTTSDVLNCGACGTVCGTGEACFSGTCALVGGEDCSDALPLSPGTSTVYWTASTLDYVTDLSCTSYDPDGPDVVMSYTATVDERVTITITPPASTRWALLLSNGTCGDLSGAQCASENADPISGSVWLPAGDTVYMYAVSSDYLSSTLDNPLAVEVDAVPAPCIPGSGGFVGTTPTVVASGISSSFSEYYVAVDESPTGWVYVGGLSDLYRMRKDGSATEDVEALAGLTSDHLGYAMAVSGTSVFTIDSQTTTPDRRVYRITSDGGATWVVQDYAFFPTVPSDDFRAAFAYGGRLYLLTEEDTSGVNTEIWSVDAAATSLPAIGTLDLTIAGEGDCSALTRDASYFYLVCYEGSRVVRVPVGGGASELISDTLDIGSSNNGVAGDDFDGDGVFDALYVKSDLEDVSFVCNPASAAPIADVLATWGTATCCNYGMGYDSTADVLWSFDDDDRTFLRFE